MGRLVVMRTSGFDGLRGMLVKTTCPALLALVNCCKSLRLPQKRRDSFCMADSTLFQNNEARTWVRPVS